MRDLHFIAGDFLWSDLPPEKEFYAFYFQTDLERQFLSYQWLFGDMYAEGNQRLWNNFMDHTGYRCTQRWFRKLLSRYRWLEAALADAHARRDLQAIADIKSGQWKIP